MGCNLSAAYTRLTISTSDSGGPFLGIGPAGLDFGASKVIGIEQEKKYIRIAEKRILEG
jgi:hypothetical protein